MYTVSNEVWGETCESSNEYSLWHYIHNVLECTVFTKLVKTSETEWKIVKVEPTDEQKQLIEEFSWCGRDWMERQLWDGYKTEKAIWYRIHQMPEWYFG